MIFPNQAIRPARRAGGEDAEFASRYSHRRLGLAPGQPCESARPIAQISGVVREAGRPEPIQQRDNVGLPTIAGLCQYNFDV